MSRLHLLLLLALLLGSAGRANAHALRMGTLQLEAESATDWQTDWAAPAGAPLALEALPPCSWEGHGSLRCPAGMPPQLALRGTQATSTHVLLQKTDLRGTREAYVLQPGTDGQLSVASAAATVRHTLLSYVELGARHIGGGWDHLLFLLLLVLVAPGWRRLALAVSGFTLAHSLSLALVALGAVHLRAPPVEALIALSLVFMAAESLRARTDNPSARLRPFVVALAFGLLHGLGFAGALVELRLAPTELPLALFGFNVGVELGQLLFVGAAVALVTAATAIVRARPQRLARVATAYAVGAVGVFWTLDRILPPWS